MFRRLLLAVTVLATLLAPELHQPGQGATKSPSDCDWTFGGKYRKMVKNRTSADAVGYTVLNGGKPISVDQFLTLVKSFDAMVPVPIPATTAMFGLESIQVKMQGFLLGAKFERSEDKDIHVEIGDVSDWV